ncbi:MAG: hypothetical protein GHHEDOFH_01564 [Pseudorhodoplanes sp.]|nr:hypothetical protein [Pseudorhodoplanes sp.]
MPTLWEWNEEKGWWEVFRYKKGFLGWQWYCILIVSETGAVLD